MNRYLFTFIILLASVPLSGEALSQAYWPSDRSMVQTTTHTPVLVEYSDGKERLVIQPSFKGTMDTITFVTLVPSLPMVRKVSPSIFSELGTITGIEQKTPPRFEDGYTTQILPLTGSATLTQFLDAKGHAYSQKDQDTFARLARQKGYAVVINFEVSENTSYDDEGFFGTLAPLEISFTVPHPLLPIQLLNSTNPVTIDLFTVGDDPYFIPGVTTFSSNRVDPYPLEASVINCVTTPCPSSWAHEYTMVTGKRWVTAQELVLNPAQVSTNLYLTTTDQEYIVSSIGSPRILRSDLFRESMGVIKGSAPEWGTSVPEYPALLGGTRLLKRGVQGEDVRELQEVLNHLLSLNLVADGIWGSKTHEGVAQFQTQYNLTIDGIVGNQTRRFLRTVLFSAE